MNFFHKPIVAITVAAAVLATPLMSRAANNCMKESANLAVGFSEFANDAASVFKPKDIYEAKAQKIAKEAGVTPLNLSSLSYSVSGNSNRMDGQRYRINANYSYTLSSTEQARKLFELFSKEGLQASININQRKDAHCQ